MTTPRKNEYEVEWDWERNLWYAVLYIPVRILHKTPISRVVGRMGTVVRGQLIVTCDLSKIIEERLT
jgi:hypothetical protein